MVFPEANLVGVASQIKKGTSFHGPIFVLLKGHPCSLPQIRVFILVADSDLHENCSGELPVTL